MFTKIRRVERSLAKEGIQFGRVRRKAGGPDPWNIADNVWLMVQIGSFAIGAYPRIRKFLQDHDFTQREIIRLDLFKHTHPPKKKKKSIKKSV
jgi:hypothetical protein